MEKIKAIQIMRKHLKPDWIYSDAIENAMFSAMEEYRQLDNKKLAKKPDKNKIVTMTVKNLKEILNTLPEGMEIFIDERLTEFKFGLVNSAKVKKIGFSENEGDKPLAYANVLVLSED